MNRTSYSAALILTVANFQFFGIYMILGINYAQDFFQFLTFTGVNCFLCSIICNKFTYYLFVAQSANHPNVNQPGIRNPRIRFYFFMISMEIFFYGLGFLIVRYPASAYFSLLLFTYPAAHVFSSAKYSNRYSYKW